jgi:hypothetical protein
MLTRLTPFAALAILMLMATGVFAQGLPAATFDGKPTFREDDELSYYVWREGSRWHLRWTTYGGTRLFTGQVTAEGGALKDLKRIDVETERRVIRPGRPGRVWRGPRGRLHGTPGRPPVVATREQDKIEREDDRHIRFVARTDDVDGFDFTVDHEVEALRFVLEIDGRVVMADVEAGKNNREILRVPFIAQLK